MHCNKDTESVEQWLLKCGKFAVVRRSKTIKIIENKYTIKAEIDKIMNI